MKALTKRLAKRLARQVLLGLALLVMGWPLTSCASDITSTQGVSLEGANATGSSSTSAVLTEKTTAQAADSAIATATFAGGCFWCMEQPFDQLSGVVETTSGYTGGEVENPTYYQVSDGNTGHVEAMQVSYDPTQVSYETLIDTFWHNIDPTDNYGQFCDKGSQYRSAIFYETAEQQSLAESTKKSVAEKLEQPVATDILPAATFYPAEDYHQDYYQTRPVRYKVYRFGCGRDQRLSDIWGAEAPNHD